MAEKIFVGKECRFAVHVPGATPRSEDYHLVKEVINYSDKSQETNLRIIKNFKRSFWITNKANQNHKSKKEWEDIKKVTEFRTTQTALGFSVASALGLGYLDRYHLRDLSNSPYLYGSDLLSTSLIKNDYREKAPDLNTPFSVCALDTETDVLYGTGEIILITVYMNDKVVQIATDGYIKNTPNYKDRLLAAADKYIKEYLVKRDIKITFHSAKDEMSLLFKAFEYLHKWKPDLVAIWNIKFDINKIIEACTRAGVDPKNLFSDPEIPDYVRYFKFKEGPNKKKKANGDIVTISPANQWHTVFSTSSFYIIDAMCVYRLVRLALPEEQSYMLDAILDKELGIRKLSFKEADNYVKLEWHRFMQQNYKVEYGVYNIFDVISMMELEYKTTDLSVALPVFAATTDFCKFNSQPRRVVDDLHFETLKDGKVIGSTGGDMVEEIDSKTLPLTNWIVTLSAHSMVDNGIECIVEDYALKTNIRLYNGDVDVGAAYPTNQCVFNVSKETTKREVIKVEGVEQEIFTMQNINLLSGEVNAVDYCTTMFNFPSLLQLSESF